MLIWKDHKGKTGVARKTAEAPHIWSFITNVCVFFCQFRRNTTIYNRKVIVVANFPKISKNNVRLKLFTSACMCQIRLLQYNRLAFYLIQTKLGAKRSFGRVG